ncbi:MAG: VWA domain-containing protein [Qingshengfaniella sp.]
MTICSEMTQTRRARFAPRIAAAALLSAGLGMPMAASAAVSVSWQSPANNSTYAVGTVVSPLGQALASGVTGAGFDFSIVMDSSGSMASWATATDGTGATVSKSRQAWQQEGAIALVNGLPDTATVSIIEFDGDANTVIGQTALNSVANRQAVIDAINTVDASGGTYIGRGIDESANNNLVPNGTAGFTQHMVVLSDGSTSGVPGNSAAAAVLAGVETIDSVAMPGSNITTMQSIATNGNGTFIDATGNIGLITGLLGGLPGGGLSVGIASLEVTTPDGTTTGVGTGVGGTFTSPAYALQLGNNIFTAFVTGTDGTSATATLNLIGVDGTAPVPLPAAGWMLLSVLGGLGAARGLRRRG